MAFNYGAEVEEDDVEEEREVIRLLTLTEQRQADNYHMWNIKLVGMGRGILQSIVELVSLLEAMTP